MEILQLTLTLSQYGFNEGVCSKISLRDALSWNKKYKILFRYEYTNDINDLLLVPNHIGLERKNIYDRDDCTLSGLIYCYEDDIDKARLLLEKDLISKAIGINKHDREELSRKIYYIDTMTLFIDKYLTKINN